MSKRKTKSAPAFQLYGSDFVFSCLDMEIAAFGLYSRLLCVCWDKCGLEDDPDALARQGGVSRDEFDRLFVSVRKRLYVDKNGLLQNKRLDQERAKQRKWRKQKRVAATVRWQKQRDADALRVHEKSDAETMPSSLQSLVSVPTHTPLPADAKHKGHHGHAFCGERFCVPNWLDDELRKALGENSFDLSAWYPTEDKRLLASGEATGEAVKYVRLRALAAAGIQVGKPLSTSHRVIQREPVVLAAWFIECAELHSGSCQSSSQHEQRKKETA